MFYKSQYISPIGKLTLASDKTNLVGLWIEGQKYFVDTITEKMIEYNNIEIFTEAKLWLDKYFEEKNPPIETLKLSPRGNEFRQSVWKILCKIPYGKTITYGDIAKEIAKQRGLARMSAQTVGNAVEHNPISIIIPCHRVIGKNGKLTGYAGGIDIKKKLLELENKKDV